MRKIQHIFKNKSLGQYNDSVFKTPFEITGKEFHFNIQPTSNTKYWRFGLRFSKTKRIEFFSPEHRYKEPEFRKYIDIHLGVGEWDGSNWSIPDRLHLAHYNLTTSPPHILNYTENYRSEGLVKLSIKYLSEFNQIYVSYRTDDGKVFSRDYPLKSDYKYFKIFAWADELRFQIECNIEIYTPDKESDPDTDSENESVVYVESASSFQITDNLTPAIGVQELAHEIGELLRRFSDLKGNMFGIFGQWGRGKTYLWNQIWNYLNSNGELKDQKFINAEFHAWKYQDTPASWAYLYETLADRYFKKVKLTTFKSITPISYLNGYYISRPFKYLAYKSKQCYAFLADQINFASKTIKLNFSRKGVGNVYYFVFGFLLYAAWLFIPFIKKIELVVYLSGSLGIIVFIKLIYLYFVYKPKAINILSMYSEKVSFQNFLGIQAEIQKEIIWLLKSWISKKNIGKKKILLFVDDIDRCSEDRIIQVVDSLKVMLEDQEIAKRVIVLVAIDERVLKMAIKLKYSDLVTKNANSDLGLVEPNTLLIELTKEYIDKLFLSGIKLGHLSIDEINQIFDSVTEHKVNPNSEKNIQPSNTPIIVDPNKPATIVTSSKPENVKNSRVLEDENYEIGQAEYRILQDRLHYYKNPTPRAIRIYFYRYMLAKNLMKYKLQEDSLLYEFWHHRDMKKSILPDLIIYYSNENRPNQIYDDCKEVLKTETLLVERSIFGLHYVLDKRLFIEVLKIVEMVVPY